MRDLNTITDEEKHQFEQVVQGMCGPMGVFKAWEKDCGHTKALNALKNWLYGTVYLNMKNAQIELGLEAVEKPEDLEKVLQKAHGRFGCRYIEVEKIDRGKRVRCVLCPFAEASNRTGWNGKEVCDEIFGPLARHISGDFSPDLEWKLVTWNPDPFQGCLYDISNVA